MGHCWSNRQREKICPQEANNAADTTVVNNAADTNVVNNASGTNVVSTAADTNVVNNAAHTKVVNSVADTNVVNNDADTIVVSNVADTTVVTASTMAGVCYDVEVGHNDSVASLTDKLAEKLGVHPWALLLTAQGHVIDLDKRATECGSNLEVCVRDTIGALVTSNARGPVRLASSAELSGRISSFCSMTWEIWLQADASLLPNDRLELLQQNEGFGIKLESARRHQLVAYRWRGPEENVELKALRGSESPGNSLDGWCRLLIVFEHSVARIYENGVLLGATRQNGRSSASGRDLTLMGPFGQFNRNSRHPVNGCFGHVRAWNRALSADHVQELFHSKSSWELPASLDDAWWLVDARLSSLTPKHDLQGAQWKASDGWR